MKVKDFMTKDVIKVDKDVNLRYVLKLMKKHDITKIPTVEDGEIVGVVTDNIIAYKLGSIRKKGVPASKLHASSVLERDFDTTNPETDIKVILDKVGKPGPTMINVVEDGKLVGVLTKADILPMVKSEEKLENIMTRKVHIVSPDDRVIHARRIMVDEEIARLPVFKKGNLVGMISDMEIAFAVAEIKRMFPIGKEKHRLDKLLVKDAMNQPAIWTEPDTKIKDAAGIMMEQNIGALPLLKNDDLKGIVTRTDLLKTVKY